MFYFEIVEIVLKNIGESGNCISALDNKRDSNKKRNRISFKRLIIS
jgi:hypothetical protein